MRALLERSWPARAAIAALSLCAVVALAHAATAGDDIGLRRNTLWPEPRPAPRLFSMQTTVQPRHARRIWAAATSRPLRIALAHRAPMSRVARAGRTPAKVAIVRPSMEPQAIFPKLIVLPKPPRPAVVAIYEDRTLRAGDAVMMADGIHVFRGAGAWPHRPRDFVRLTFAAALDWHLRETLDVLDRNPPTRWTSIDAAAG